VLYYAVLHVSKTVYLLNIPSIIAAHFQEKQKKKKIRTRLEYVPGYFVHVTALQCAATPNLAVVTHSLTF